jgi:hypothetical protein
MCALIAGKVEAKYAISYVLVLMMSTLTTTTAPLLSGFAFIAKKFIKSSIEALIIFFTKEIFSDFVRYEQQNCCFLLEQNKEVRNEWNEALI